MNEVNENKINELKKYYNNLKLEITKTNNKAIDNLKKIWMKLIKWWLKQKNYVMKIIII